MAKTSWTAGTPNAAFCIQCQHSLWAFMRKAQCGGIAPATSRLRETSDLLRISLAPCWRDAPRRVQSRFSNLPPVDLFRLHKQGGMAPKVRRQDVGFRLDQKVDGRQIGQQRKHAGRGHALRIVLPRTCTHRPSNSVPSSRARQRQRQGENLVEGHGGRQTAFWHGASPCRACGRSMDEAGDRRWAS